METETENTKKTLKIQKNWTLTALIYMGNRTSDSHTSRIPRRVTPVVAVWLTGCLITPPVTQSLPDDIVMKIKTTKYLLLSKYLKKTKKIFICKLC